MTDMNENFETRLLKINNYLSSFISEKPPKQPSDEEHLKASKTHPASRSDFENRLATFEYGTWAMLEISPLQCAQSGWTYHGTNMLHCATCEVFLCTALPSPCETEAYSDALNTLKLKLKEHHKMWCGWRDNWSPIEFTMPPLTLSVHYLNELKTYTHNLISLKKNIPYFLVTKILEKLKIQTDDLKIIVADGNFDETKIASCLLTLCGWRTTKTNQIRCHMCLRSIGLWNFYSLEEKYKYEGVEMEKLVIDQKLKVRETKRRKKMEDAEAEKVRLLAEEQKRKDAELELQEDRLLEGADSHPSSELDEEELMQDIASSAVGSHFVVDMNSVCSVMEPQGENGFLNGHDPKAVTVSVPTLITDLMQSPSIDQNGSMEEEDLWIAALGYAKPDADQQTKSSDSSCSSFREDSPTEDNTKTGKMLTVSDRKQEKIATGTDKEPEKIDTAADRELANMLNGSDKKSEYTTTECTKESENTLTECNRESESSPTVADRGLEINKEPKETFNGGGKDITSMTGDSLNKASDESEENFQQNSDASINISHEAEGIPSISLGSILAKAMTDDGSDQVANSCDDNNSKICESTKRKRSSSRDSSETANKRACPQPDEIRDSSTSDDVEKEEEINNVEHSKFLFDPIEEHRYWCGWVTNIDKSFNSTLKGYMVIPPQLKSFQATMDEEDLINSEKYANNVEGLRALRAILQTGIYEEC